METAYTGYLGRTAHFGARPPVPGVSSSHGSTDPAGENDLFQPMPETPDNQANEVWEPQETAPQGPVPYMPISHWTDLQPPVPTNVHVEEAGWITTDRMIANHSQEAPHLNQYPVYAAATQGYGVEWEQGQGSMESGETIDPSLQYLVAGRNAYDYTNQPNEVYSAEETGGSRYRLGLGTKLFGLYEFWTKQGQDADMRAYTGLVPWLPVDKERVPDSAPYTPNSSGTTTWVMPAERSVSQWTLPSETNITDYQVSTEPDDTDANSDYFEDDGRL
jgi:hypothetical protein